MKKTTLTIKLLARALAVLGILLVLSIEGRAQAIEGSQGSANPYQTIAEKIGVSAYPMGTFDREHTIEILNQIISGLEPIVGGGGGTTVQKLKLQFCQGVLGEVKDRYVAPELAMLTELSKLSETQSAAGNNANSLVEVYNQVAAQL